jgi:hypothetical protein
MAYEIHKTRNKSTFTSLLPEPLATCWFS